MKSVLLVLVLASLCHGQEIPWDTSKPTKTTKIVKDSQGRVLSIEEVITLPPPKTVIIRQEQPAIVYQPVPVVAQPSVIFQSGPVYAVPFLGAVPVQGSVTVTRGLFGRIRSIRYN